MILILVKGDDIRSGRKAKARYGQHRSQWVNNTFSLYFAFCENNIVHILGAWK